MKRLWIALLCLALCAPWTAGLSEEAQAEGGSGDFSYELMGDGAARITGYSGEGGALEIPAEMDGYPVTVIGREAFYQCAGLTSATIPAGVERIEASAFYGCEALASVELPAGLKGIDEYAFYECGSLAAIALPEGLETIGADAFDDCDSLASVVFPASLKRIEASTFYSCDALASVEWPAGLTAIDELAFAYCDSLTELALPEGLTFLGVNAFADCGNLTSVALPDSLSDIGGEPLLRLRFSGGDRGFPGSPGAGDTGRRAGEPGGQAADLRARGLRRRGVYRARGR